MKSFVHCFIVLIALLSCFGCREDRRASDGGKRPNVVFIITDDQRADTLGIAGNQSLPTPNIDRLASCRCCSFVVPESRKNNTMIKNLLYSRNFQLPTCGRLSLRVAMPSLTT